MFFFDPLFLLFAVPGLVLGMWAQSRVRRNFNKYSKVGLSRNITGQQVARQLLDSHGLYDVGVEETQGFLSDHYDPRSKTLRLSPGVYRSTSVAAAGIAAHEMGHALQDEVNYFPLNIRSALVPAAQFGSNFYIWPIMAGFLLNVPAIAWLGVILLAASVLFTLVTLPVEFDASRRAKKLLVSDGLLFDDELAGVNKVLDAAALTYVAAFISSLGTLLFYVFRLSGGGRD